MLLSGFWMFGIQMVTRCFSQLTKAAESGFVDKWLVKKTIGLQISKRSEVQTLPGFKWSKKVGLRVVQILNGICNPEAQPFQFQTNGCHFVKSHFKSRHKCQDFELSCFSNGWYNSYRYCYRLSC